MTIRPPFSKSVGLCAGKISMFSKPYFVREMILIFITTSLHPSKFFSIVPNFNCHIARNRYFRHFRFANFPVLKPKNKPKIRIVISLAILFMFLCSYIYFYFLLRQMSFCTATLSEGCKALFWRI